MLVGCMFILVPFWSVQLFDNMDGGCIMLELLVQFVGDPLGIDVTPLAKVLLAES